MNAKFSKTLPAHIIDDIINITHSSNLDQSGIFKGTEAITHDVLRFLSAANTSASKSNAHPTNVGKCDVHAARNVIEKLPPAKINVSLWKPWLSSVSSFLHNLHAPDS